MDSNREFDVDVAMGIEPLTLAKPFYVKLNLQPARASNRSPGSRRHRALANHSRRHPPRPWPANCNPGAEGRSVIPGRRTLDGHGKVLVRARAAGASLRLVAATAFSSRARTSPILLSHVRTTLNAP